MSRRGVKTIQVPGVSPDDSDHGELHGVLTVLSGGRPGMIIPVREDELTIGRTEESTVALYDESLSRRHARFSKRDGRYLVDDLASTNGTFVNGARIEQAVLLEDGARIQLGVGTLLRFTLQSDAELAVTRRIYEATVRDPLTGCFNRHFFEERLEAELSYAKRHGAPLGVLFVDADNFKQVNDTHGHAAGDEVLRRLAELLKESVRSEDILARFGGEEFVILVRGTPEAGVRIIAERVRAGVEAMTIELEDQSIPMTVSVGVASTDATRPVASPTELLGLADSALYRAKEAGRNRVEGV
jgi:two-component system, cell cycle response regulator